MGRAEISSGQGSSRNGRRRYRSTEDIDPAELRQQVSWWLDEHPDGTGEQMIADLSPVYPEYDPGELAIVLRAAHFAEEAEPPAVSGALAGTGRVADDLWLMAHHETSGRPFLQPRPLGIGLAGAQLAELVLGGCVFVDYDGAVAARRTWPGDGLARKVRDQVAAEPERHTVPEWLLFLGQSAAPDVAARLEQAGYVTRALGRVPWRAPRWVPVDPDWAFAPLLRARPATDAARPLTAHAAVLAGLAVGCGLGFRLDQYLPAAGRSVDEAVSQLPPDLQKLAGAVQAAVGGAVLSHRT